MNNILRASVFANVWHNGQFRKYSKDPYILHPMRVAGRTCLLPFYITQTSDQDLEDAVCAAWLHDVIEDCGITPEHIEGLFNKNVRDIVVGLTEFKDPTKNRKTRKKETLDKLQQESNIVKIIKMIDRIDNLRDMNNCMDDFLFVYKRESRDLAEALKDSSEILYQELIKLC